MKLFHIFSTIYSKRALGAAFCFALLIFSAAAPATRAQDPDEKLTFETTDVKLNIGVVDRQGHTITYLSQSDFAVYEDGVKRPITHFEPTDAPFSLVMLLDMSGSTLNFRQQIQQAAIRFLDVLGPSDRVAVVEFSGTGPKAVKLLQGFSTDRGRARYAITLAAGAAETPFYRALQFALKELSKEAKRRKAIVVLTDGIDTDVRTADTEALARAALNADVSTVIKPENNPQLNAVLNEAASQGVTIFPLALPSGDPKRLPLIDSYMTAKYTAARTRMQMLADRTGGRLNEISSLDQMARLYVEVGASLRALYTLAYSAPGDRPRDGKWHEIRVEVTRPELIARTRPGYYAK